MLRDWFRMVQFPVIGLVSLLLICPQVIAQDESGEGAKPDPAAEKTEIPKPEAKPAETEKPAKDAAKPDPTADKPEPKTPAEPSAPAEPETSEAGTFDAKFTEWKELLKKLRELQAEFRIAGPEKEAELRGQWDELIAKGEAMIPELREAGTQAYLAAPNENDELTDFLVKLVANDVLKDDCEAALELAGILLDNGCDKKELHEPVGMAAFGTNDFDRAEEYLKKAKEEDSISDKARELIALLGKFQEDWKKELEIRQKEEADNLPRVKLTTTKGDIVVELFENEAPGTVGNFVSLVENEFYNGKTFHRVLAGFMAQAGCPNGDGTGGPGYTIYCECNKDDYRRHFRGTLSMAKTLHPNTGGSQFFLTFRPTPQLNGKHTAFGRVIEGMEVLNKLQRIDPEADGPKPEPDRIVKAEVVRKRDHEYKPNIVN